MEKGLLWLPLLFIFFWLTWMGWKEYQKVEAYRVWAEQFEKAKYDIYAVLAQQGKFITWGKPTPKGPIELQTFSLDEVTDIHLLVNEQPVSLELLPKQGQTALAFVMADGTLINIPFTEIPLAAKWANYLQQIWRS